jgi:hypothetical protein
MNVPKGRRKPQFSVSSKHDNSHLGVIEWWAYWKQYVFTPDIDSIYSADCLGEIIKKLTELEGNKTLSDSVQ